MAEEKPEKKPEDIVESLSAEDKEALAFGRKQLKERREKMIKGIQANTDKIWPDEVLNAMDEDNLERVYESVKKEEEVNYSLNSSTRFSGNEEEALYPGGEGPEYAEKETK